MTERLLHFIWQFQYFNRNELATTAGEPVQILSPGLYNTNQGPDFSAARIRIGTTTWAGTAELHVRSSDWIKHRHQEDQNYDNVILHVVWEDDGLENNIPVLELQERVPKILLERYRELMDASSFIPCEKMIHTVNALSWKSWKERLMAERLLRKAGIVEQLLKENYCHWEETTWWLLARNFGVRVNGAAFEEMARSLPVNLLSRHRSQIHQLEALLLGQSGLLNDRITDDYYNLLQREYVFLKQKYKLRPIHLPVHFLRMRPGNFPTVRLAQLAAVIQKTGQLFSDIKDANSLKDVKAIFDVAANDYWHYHYRFGETSAFKKKNLGDSMTDNIIINTVCPVLFAYGNYHREQGYKDKALNWLGNTPAESNTLIKGFMQLGTEVKNAFDSQALIELKNDYCNNKKCLECGVGNAVLKNSF